MIDEQRAKMGIVLLEVVILFFMNIMLYFDNEHAEENVGTLFDLIIVLVHVPAMAYSIVRDPRYYTKRTTNANSRSKVGRQQLKTYESDVRVANPRNVNGGVHIGGDSDDDDDLAV